MSPSPSPQTITPSTDPLLVAASCATHNLTPTEFHTLREKATKAKSTAYCPYSNFHVGAVLLTHSGVYISGANVENASYPVTTCAERVAFGKAITEGHRGFKAVAVATDISPPASPCGMCRQCIREFCDLNTPIIMFDVEEKYTIMRLEELLPLSFGPEALGVQSQSQSQSRS